MGVATKLMGKLNDSSYAALSAVPGVTPFQGRVRMPDTTDFETTVRALDPETECVAMTWVGMLDLKPLEDGNAEVICLLFFNLPKDSSSDCNSMYDKVSEISVALTRDATWEDVACRSRGVTCLRVEDGLQDDVVEWRLIVSLSIPPAC